MQEYYVYIMASGRNGTLYVGMAEGLKGRVAKHRNGSGSKFVQKYEINQLVYFERYENKQTALVRERQLKKWNRRWKIRLIEQLNPNWKDICPKVKIYGSPAEDRVS